MAAPPTPDQQIDDLFALPPGDFVVARDRLAKDLKGAGQTEAAATVKKLRRPTVAAHAVNRLAHEAPEEIDELVALGESLRQAHAALLAGGGDAGIREATTRRRKLVGNLTTRALTLLGAGEGQREAIAQTLEAAVADPGAAEAVRAGRLTRELEAPSTFGAGLVFVDEPVEDSARAEDTIDGEESQQAAADASTRAELIHRLQEDVERTSRAAEEAAREVEHARREVDQLGNMLDSARAQLRSAEDTELSARAAAEQARQELEKSHIR